MTDDERKKLYERLEDQLGKNEEAIIDDLRKVLRDSMHFSTYEKAMAIRDAGKELQILMRMYEMVTVTTLSNDGKIEIPDEEFRVNFVTRYRMRKDW